MPAAKLQPPFTTPLSRRYDLSKAGRWALSILMCIVTMMHISTEISAGKWDYISVFLCLTLEPSDIYTCIDVAAMSPTGFCHALYPALPVQLDFKRAGFCQVNWWGGVREKKSLETEGVEGGKSKYLVAAGRTNRAPPSAHCYNRHDWEEVIPWGEEYSDRCSVDFKKNIQKWYITSHVISHLHGWFLHLRDHNLSIPQNYQYLRKSTYDISQWFTYLNAASRFT